MVWLKCGVITQSWCLGLGLILCFCFLNHSYVVESTTYNVGDKLGWCFNVSAWPSGKSFKAGDELGEYIIFIFILFYLFFFIFAWVNCIFSFQITRTKSNSLKYLESNIQNLKV